MAIIEPNEEFIKKHWAKTVSLLQQYNLDAVLKMLDDLQEEYTTAPASSMREYHSAFPGGLCYHNLHVLKWMGQFAGCMGVDLFSKESLLKVSILHDVGKVGRKGNPYYVSQSEDWKLKKGMLYEVNDDFGLKVSELSLFLCQEYDIKLSSEEWAAISCYDRPLSFRYDEGNLALALKYASYWAIRQEKKNTVKL